MNDSVVLEKCQGCGSWYCKEMGCYYDIDETGL